MHVDRDPADRLLAGASPEGLPPGDGQLATLLEDLRAEGTPRELAREAEAVAAIVATVRSHSTMIVPTPRRSFMPRLTRAKLVLAAAALVLATAGGAAAAGGLPDPLQSAVASALDKAGISIPNPSSERFGGEAVPQQAQAGQATAAGKHAAALDYADAVEAWTACVSSAASAQGETSGGREFNPMDACGPHPNAADFGLTAPAAGATEGLPEQALAGQATASERHGAAVAYTEAIRDWSGCVNDAASAQGGSNGSEVFDPLTVCGPSPNPEDFGFAEAPPARGAGGAPAETGAPPSSGAADAPAGAGQPVETGPPVDPSGAGGPPSSVPTRP